MITFEKLTIKIMNRIISFALVIFSSLVISISNAQDMNKQQMAKLLGKETTIVNSTVNSWTVKLNDLTIFIVIDESANRMRIISPAAFVKDLKKNDYLKLLKANYHTALDAKYAIDGDYVWSTYIHPLKELGDEEFISGLYQVRNLVLTYGSAYSSTNLVFGGGNEEE